jgi:5-(carboxyamino)imidazole ribonucleotide synthase
MKDKRIGILGGGQLGLMMAQSCADWHMEPVFLEPDPEAAVLPYGKVVGGSFRDYDTVRSFGADFDVISYEIEDVNLAAIKELEAGGKQVYPQPSVLYIIKNKKRQKQFLVENGFPTSPFVDFSPADLSQYTHFLPAFWKQDEGGYDGKGVMRVGSPSDFSKLPESPGFLEKAVSVQREIAVIVARNASGEVKTFPSVEMVFHPEANLVEYLQCPAQISTENDRTCQELAVQLITRLNMIGLLAVEFFIDENGQVLVNEMAPRPHNSGHHTIEANLTSQFAQYWRAILNLPLGDTRQIHPFAAMINLIGEEGFTGKPVYQGLEEVLSQSGVFVHIYGKSQARPFRKMGHVTVVADSLADLQQKVSFVKNHLKVSA